MEFREILNKDLNKNVVALGTRQGGMLTLNIDNYPSILITGETGSGKSVLLNQILLQMINKTKSDELQLILIDTTGVELNQYNNTNHKLLSALGDLDKAQEILMKVLEEIERRKNILSESNVSSIQDYNELFNHNLPKLLIAIDDNKSLLNTNDTYNMISKILDGIDDLNMMLVLSTNDVHNRFFDDKKNMLSKVLISFDTANEQDAVDSLMPFSNDLLTGRFIIYKDGDYEEYHNIEFDENIIKEIID